LADLTPANRSQRHPGEQLFHAAHSDNAFLPSNVKDAIPTNACVHYNAPTTTVGATPTRHDDAPPPAAATACFGPHR
jgi:hypothetical protein